jgi:hypothetical protein
MPYRFDFDPANGILLCRLSGLVTDDALRDFFRAGAGIALKIHPTAGVVDLTEVTSFDVSAKTLREQSKVSPNFRNPRLRRIIIAPSPDTYGMMRMFELEGEEVRPEIHVVRTEKEAWAILAVENPLFEPLKIP